MLRAPCVAGTIEIARRLGAQIGESLGAQGRVSGGLAPLI